MRLFLISGDGHGAGKTYLAKKIAFEKKQIFSIADGIRRELHKEYPKYDWFNKEPRYKINTIVQETNKNVLKMLEDRGQLKKSQEKLFWVNSLIEDIESAFDKDKLDLIVIDDLRYVDEYEFLKRYFEKANITHLHIKNPHAKEEKFDNSILETCADYVMVSKRVLKYRKIVLEKI